MRIAFICQPFPPMVSGLATVSLRLAESLATEGHNVIVFAASSNGKAYLSKVDNLEIQFLPSLNNPFRVDHRFMLWPKKKILQELLKFKPDIIHLEDLLIGTLITLRLKRYFQHVPIVLTLHQLPWFISAYLPSFIYRYIESPMWKYGIWVYNRVDAVITPSKTISKIIYSRTGLLCVPITNGVDTNLFAPRDKKKFNRLKFMKKYHLNPKIPIIIYVGRVDKDKRVSMLLTIFKTVLNSTVAQLVIVGDGVELSDIKEQANELGITKYCRFTGYVSPQQDLPQLYRLAQVFVTASRVEIQSSVALEASASGVPSVVFDIGSMPEYITHRKTGYRIEIDNVKAFADAVILLIKQKKLARKLGRAARNLSLLHANAISVKKHLGLYNKLMTNKRYSNNKLTFLKS